MIVVWKNSSELSPGVSLETNQKCTDSLTFTNLSQSSLIILFHIFFGHILEEDFDCKEE